jgi:hypothetical protein
MNYAGTISRIPQTARYGLKKRNLRLINISSLRAFSGARRRHKDDLNHGVYHIELNQQPRQQGHPGG